jgi:peptide chain release factor 2
LKKRIEELDAQSTQPDFWNDQVTSQKLMKERADKDTMVKAVESLQADVRDAGELLELAAMESDESVARDVETSLTALETRCRKLELDQMLSEPEDRGDAIIEINAGAGGVDARQARIPSGPHRTDSVARGRRRRARLVPA